MTIGNPNYKTDPDKLRREADAEREHAAFVAESKDRLSPKCPECGALGSLEEVDGEVRCIDCDLVVGAKTKLPGFGRR
ncbi:MAG: hypothetical protein IPK82_37650 [Polyangiaceae bacterium]|nr:hypothetical protein [Polyangiaceae bacterium]